MTLRHRWHTLVSLCLPGPPFTAFVLCSHPHILSCLVCPYLWHHFSRLVLLSLFKCRSCSAVSRVVNLHFLCLVFEWDCRPCDGNVNSRWLLQTGYAMGQWDFFFFLCCCFHLKKKNGVCHRPVLWCPIGRVSVEAVCSINSLNTDGTACLYTWQVHSLGSS